MTNYLHLNLWWKNFLGGTSPDDTLFININDGTLKENLFYINGDNSRNWYQLSLEIPNIINLNSFKIEITTADWTTGVDHLVEAGIDNFYIDNYYSTNITNSTNNSINVFPNPTPNGMIYIDGIQEPFEYYLFNISGKLVKMGSENDIQILRKGVYILKIKKEKSIIFRKIIY
jgi:hypothetical protein